MTKYCRECLRELKLEEQNDEICKWCKEKIKERKFENLYDYNYINDKVIKDSWDNQARRRQPQYYTRLCLSAPLRESTINANA